MRLCWILVLALALVAPSASAQSKKKPKKPKKPKTEQRAEPKEDAEEPSKTKDDDPPRSSDPEDHPPPPIDTNLREEDPTSPTTNPWAAAGIAKKKGVEAPKPGESSSSSDSGLEARKKPSSDWVSRPLAVTAAVGYASENLRIGFGARVGYSFLDTYYVGAAFTYHLGTSFGQIAIGGYYPAAELGYDYHIQGVTIRPYSGIGMFFPSVRGAPESVDVQSGSAFAVYPGVHIDYQVAGPGFVGIDGRVLLVFQDGSDPSIGVFAVGGARF
jgi:hypothetical protein